MSPISSRKSVPPRRRVLEDALAVFLRAGEGAAHVPEELVLEQRLRPRRRS
jgi:hypothetical protein